MNKNDVIFFFDSCAEIWDNDNYQNESTLNMILCYAGIEQGKSVLDVACGTGVLFDEYFKKGVLSLTAIDISSEMVKVAKSKYPQVNVLCGDAESYDFKIKFDCIVIYNAFPHFVRPEQLFENLTAHLNDGGRLTVAHGMSREDILKCHSGKAHHISKELPTADKLADFMKDFVCVDTVVSDNEMYIVSGVKK